LFKSLKRGEQKNSEKGFACQEENCSPLFIHYSLLIWRYYAGPIETGGR
jgi:hypothetical protein